jgi:uncharacterized protein YbjT (DUF2867 family)
MILVTGATGNVGSETVRLLADQQQPVRALVRDPSRLQRAGVDVVTGDFDDPGSLDAAMDGVDTVVLVSPAIPPQEISVIDAAVRAGVTHAVKATSKASADSPVARRDSDRATPAGIWSGLDTAALQRLPAEPARPGPDREADQRIRHVRR